MIREIFLFKSHAEKEARRLVPDFFLFLKKLSIAENKYSAAKFQYL